MADDKTLEKLVSLLQDDINTRTEQLMEMNRQLEARNRLLEQEITKKATPYKWYSGIAGLAAIVVGIWVFSLIWHMVDDMNHMAVYMQNMGASEADTPVAGSKKLEKSYMHAMSDDMQSMRKDMGAMNVAMTEMRQDMHAMQGDIGTMNTSMSTMNDAMVLMSHDMHTMNQNVGGMAQSVGGMNYNVSRMARDTDIMKEPFRVMDDFIPW